MNQIEALQAGEVYSVSKNTLKTDLAAEADLLGSYDYYAPESIIMLPLIKL